MRFSVATWRWLLAGSFLLGPAAQAQAQLAPAATAPHGYDFLTVTTMQSGNDDYSKILLTPAFEGKSSIQLDDFNGLMNEKNIVKLQHNLTLINQQLSALTVAGWELVQVYVSTVGPVGGSTHYLFRKARP